MTEKEIDEIVVKYCNMEAGNFIEFHSEYHHTEKGERFCNVTFEGALGRAHKNISDVLSLNMERQKAERIAELKIRIIYCDHVPYLSLYEEFELHQLLRHLSSKSPINLEPQIAFFSEYKKC